jgi:hypothetical protein
MAANCKSKAWRLHPDFLQGIKNDKKSKKLLEVIEKTRPSALREL